MRSIMIVGGGSGVGLALAHKLAKKGCELHLVGRHEARLQDAAEPLKARWTVCDVREDRAIEALIEAVQGPLDGLVYAAGSINLKPIQRLSSADFADDFRVNAVGAALVTKGLLPLLKKSEHQPAIVLFSSVAVSQGFPFHASVSMAKGAVEGLTRALAAELAPRVRVNCIAPSLTRTPLAQTLLSRDGAEQNIAALHPLQRIGEADDIAALAEFLLSPEAGWISGQVIGVDGGRSSLRSKG